MQLFTFFQSGSAYRVRIAMNLKGIDYEPVFIKGGRDSQDLRAPEYLKLNPQATVPTLVDGDVVLTQSMAIVEYLEEIQPEPSVLPSLPADRARVRALAQIISSDTHSLSTARVLNYLDDELALQPAPCRQWFNHWTGRGLGIVETLLATPSGAGQFCHGDHPTLADIFLIPQVSTAMRFECDMSPYPTIMRIYETSIALPAFAAAAPNNQPDAPASA